MSTENHRPKINKTTIKQFYISENARSYALSVIEREHHLIILQKIDESLNEIMEPKEKGKTKAN